MSEQTQTSRRALMLTICFCAATVVFWLIVYFLALASLKGIRTEIAQQPLSAPNWLLWNKISRHYIQGLATLTAGLATCVWALALVVKTNIRLPALLAAAALLLSSADSWRALVIARKTEHILQQQQAVIAWPYIAAYERESLFFQINFSKALGICLAIIFLSLIIHGVWERMRKRKKLT